VALAGVLGVPAGEIRVRGRAQQASIRPYASFSEQGHVKEACLGLTIWTFALQIIALQTERPIKARFQTSQVDTLCLVRDPPEKFRERQVRETSPRESPTENESGIIVAWKPASGIPDLFPIKLARKKWWNRARSRHYSSSRAIASMLNIETCDVLQLHRRTKFAAGG
jgi:hypothetical protein